MDRITRILSAAFLLLCLRGTVSYAQIPVTAPVSAAKPFVDHLAVTDDLDAILTISFDEEKNSLSVQIRTYGTFFLFEADTPYKSVISCGKLKPSRLPFPAAAPLKSKFKLKSSFKKCLPDPVRKYVFRQWYRCEGLTPVESDCNMVNESVVKQFGIEGKREVVSLCLRDVCVMEPCGKEGVYKLVSCRDLLRKYDIVILRDHCHGMSGEVAESRKLLSDLRSTYDSLNVKFPDRIAGNAESLEFFNAVKAIALKNFTKQDTDCLCDSIYNARLEYNALVDTLAAMTVSLPPEPEPEVVEGISVAGFEALARKIDLSVARWLVSRDELEKKDIEKSCLESISEGRMELKEKGVRNAEQVTARDRFLKAASYFSKTCDR